MIYLLRTALMDGDPRLAIFERAGLELCRFSHDAFPEVVDLGRFMVRPLLVTEWVEGRTIAELVEADDLTSDRALRILDGTRRALQAAHHEGMAHGAITAESVLVTSTGAVKIPDLFPRWLAHQLSTGAAPIQTRSDMQAVVDLSRLLLHKRKGHSIRSVRV